MSVLGDVSAAETELLQCLETAAKACEAISAISDDASGTASSEADARPTSSADEANRAAKEATPAQLEALAKRYSDGVDRVEQALLRAVSASTSNKVV